MSAIKSFKMILQGEMASSDQTWDFNVPNLPSSIQLNQTNLVKSISFVSTPKTQSIQLHMERCPENRITHSEFPDSLLLVSFANFRLRDGESRADGSTQLATMRDSAAYVAKVLKTGISFNGTRFHFFGHSNSQLKSRSCFMLAASKREISAKIDSFGDFTKLKSVGKKVKRLGLLFSNATMAITLLPERCEDIDDISRDDYVYTDGCGLISDQLAKKIVQRRRIVHRNTSYLPSVFQIRYRGYKGVLTLCPDLKQKVQVQFRQSMRKFKDVKDLSFSVVEYSKPYAFGYLNDEIVLLIHSLGISAEVLLQKQMQHLQFLERVLKGDPQAAFRFASLQDETKLAEKVLVDGVEAVKSPLQGMVREEHSKLLNKREEQRCRIMIPESRLLFGVCDPTRRDGPGKLRPGTCFVRITLDGDGRPRTLVNTQVLVTRNPCLHPGDVQKFQVVDVPQLSHLVDCIVFPTCGPRPSADLMSGGDLDGDKFFVTWDPDIIPRKVAEPAEYPGVKEKITFHKITDEDRADFFANYSNASLGRVKNLYLDWARLKGPMSAECQQLNRLFSQCVDGNRIKVPSSLEDPPKPAEDFAPFILDTLHDAARAFINTTMNRTPRLMLYPFDVVDIFANRDELAFSEFELIQMVLRKCDDANRSFIDYAPCFNYSALSDAQQAWLLTRLPASKHLPSLVKNGLVQSQLMTIQELRNFGLQHSMLHWKPVFQSHADRMGRFLSTVSRSLELFHKKLIVLRVDKRLSLLLYVPQKVPRASEVCVDASVRVFALPHSSGAHSVKYRVVPTKVDYRVYCDENTFQLYQGHRKNTFVFLTAGPVDESSFRQIDGEGDYRRAKQVTVQNGTNHECRISVALDKISKPIQTHVGRLNRAGVLAAEIYVISNRDVESMQFLDKWLGLVDTEETLPLFEAEYPAYRVPSLDDIDRNNVPPAVARAVWEGDYSTLAMMSTVNLQTTLQLLNDAGKRAELRTVYTTLLQSVSEDNSALDGNAVLRVLLHHLPQAVFLTQLLLESSLWKTSKDRLDDEAGATLPRLLEELILEANNLQAFVRLPFFLVLQELKQMSVSYIGHLTELVALSVEQPEFALDLLVECVGAEAPRLLPLTPLETQHLTNCLFGVALDHIDEASNCAKLGRQTVSLRRAGQKDGSELLEAVLRIDVGALPRTGDHMRFVASTTPENVPLSRPSVIDAVVHSLDQNTVTFRCVHRPPVFVSDCTWKYKHCGSFVTGKAMLDAMVSLYTEKTHVCSLYYELLDQPRDSSSVTEPTLTVQCDENLNASQNKALGEALRNALALIWGPPGTGKTQTIVAILMELLRTFVKSRVLVTAPTHNAVDNILQRFVDQGGSTNVCEPLRVSTSLGKVSPGLHRYTCDAMFSKDLTDDFAGRREAQRRVQSSRLVFTTCVGAALGLLRSEKFDIVIVDEASQQTEPATLIPLTKGCQRAILVGDHVQLRATVQKHAVVSGFDISLFERLYIAPKASRVANAMLDTQYRMHQDICRFSSDEFYDGRLRTAPDLVDTALPPSRFPWPASSRTVFVPCQSSEDLGRQSKSNQGQVEMCKAICKLLTSLAPDAETTSDNALLINDIVILTPYTRQRELLQSALPAFTVCSIDGFQGREARIVIFVTVRSNASYDVGFLKDLRRLNVVMTRAKAGIVIIGDKATLIGRNQDEVDTESKDVWRRLLSQCHECHVLPSMI